MFLDASVGDLIAESLEGFCGWDRCGFFMVYPCGGDHTGSLKHREPETQATLLHYQGKTFKGEMLARVSNTPPLALISNCSENGNLIQVP